MQIFITLGDIVGLVLLALTVLVAAFIGIATAWRQWRCKHERVSENQRCHAICRDCGKDLGFIQTWRDAHKEG